MAIIFDVLNYMILKGSHTTVDIHNADAVYENQHEYDLRKDLSAK